MRIALDRVQIAASRELEPERQAGHDVTVIDHTSRSASSARGSAYGECPAFDRCSQFRLSDTDYPGPHEWPAESASRFAIPCRDRQAHRAGLRR